MTHAHVSFDVTAPWLAPYRPMLDELQRAAALGTVADALNAARTETTSAFRFVGHRALPEGEPYESFIYRTRCIPTRDNLHDLFNGLMWLTYPRTKQRLNELQAREISEHGISGSRGPLRDALTVFDENVAVLRASPELIDALRRREWHEVFIAQRAQWSSARLLLFGHALLEKLARPRKGITAHVWLVDDVSDESIASTLQIERLCPKPFLPLPVLGVPGWWAANEDPVFYDDADVFRPPRG